MTSERDPPALLVDNAVKAFGSIRAVDGVSFSAAPGVFIALLGPNGAGKTTLFQLLAGLFVVAVACRHPFLVSPEASQNAAMAWTTPVLIEICIGLEIKGYLPPDVSEEDVL